MAGRYTLGAAVAVLLALAAPALAQPEQRMAELLRLDEVLEIVREEGLEHGADIGAAVLGPSAGASWRAAVARVHDPEAMRGLMLEGFAEALPRDPEALARIESVLASDLGQRVVELELGARRAMLDPGIEDAARDAWAAQAAEGGPRVDTLRRFVEVGDLVERNVTGGLNATLAFYVGLAEGGGALAEFGEADMLADVQAQESGIRAEVEGWLHAYLALAFAPLPPEDLAAHVDFFDTADGRALNAALFAGFNGMFETLSRRLGQAAGTFAQGEDL
ncbi:hypothetical protein [Rhodobaculum claviforme]|uniref:hypothetical protein n=1 Tax=Rhodobaculum claviforme TaxID=1549854 RepID=UPI0019126550|nr:hypothetical protein [Rhodobaculum claviforme]